MPYHYKNRNNKSHKSTTSTKSTDSVTKEDDDFGSILKFTKPSSRRSTPKMVSPDSPTTEYIISTPSTPPSPPPPTPWDLLGMTEEDFVAMQQRVYQRMLEYDREVYVQNMLDDLNNPSYWQRRMESLEKEREYFNKKRGWSAADMVCVERIDADLQECEDEIERIYAAVDRLEVEYD